MIVIPAIDIRKGRCVRLVQGRKEDEIVYSSDPVSVARRWKEMGASLIHVVDLDGAFEGRARNRDIVKSMVESVDVDVQVGGGIRDEETATSYLAMDRVRRIILGTSAYENMEFVKNLSKRYPGRIAVGIDARDGMVAIKGWKDTTDIKAVELARRLEDGGISCIIYTDISRDGMLRGPNTESIEEMVRAVDIPVIASGGVSSRGDVERLRGIKGLEGVIIGRALYTGDVDLREVI